MIELNQYHASEYDQTYYISFLQATSECDAHDWGKLLPAVQPQIDSP